MSEPGSNCHCPFEITGREYHYDQAYTYQNLPLKYFLHFLQKSISFTFLLVLTMLIFIKYKKKMSYYIEGSIFYYLDSVIDELKEEIVSSVSYIVSTSNNKKERKDKYNTFSKQNFSTSSNSKKMSSEFRKRTNTQTTQNLNKTHINRNVMDYEAFSFEGKNKENLTSKISMEEEQDYYQNPIYICDFYECCCECCCECWFDCIYKRLMKKYCQIKMKIIYLAVANAKKSYFFFIVIGMFYETSIINILSLIISRCLYENLQNYFYILLSIFSIFQIVGSALYFFANVFLISFLSTRREFTKIDPNDKIGRGRLVYYHINKAFIYAILHLILQMLVKMIFFFERPFYEVDEGSDTSLFWFLKYTFFFSFIMLRYNNWNKSSLIQEDCEIQKNQNKFFAIKNVLLKYLPRSEHLYQIIKEKEMEHGMNSPIQAKKSIFEYREQKKFQSLSYFGDELQKNMKDSKLELISTLSIIDKQKFKRILRNRGTFTFIPKILIYVFIFHSIAYIIICIISLMEKNLVNFDVGTTTSNAILACIFLLNISEFTLIPILVCFTLRRRYYFDYHGEMDNKWKYDEL